jgi:uncharacterized protein (UPF0210 family)
MKVRALTGFIDPGWPFNPEAIESVAACLQACHEALQEVGIEVQTLRLATPPPSKMNAPVPPADRADLARKLEAECFAHSIDYAAIGPALPDEPEGYDVIPKILAATENVFTSGIFTNSMNGISLSAARACAQAIHDSSAISPDGFANLRFAALANVPPGAPFFPSAFHDSGPAAIAVATEAADVVVEAIQNASTFDTARRHLVVSIEDHASTLTQITKRVASKHDFRFLGIDFSLAPFPEERRSIGTAMEAFGIPAAGLSGTVAAATFIMDCLDRAKFPRTGFCGLFLPVLEDSVLAARAAEGILTITHLLLYATLCGTGLDLIPLPGDISPGAMASLLIDLGALALRHNKPLTARLMPIPGKDVGDEIHYDFAYFTDSRVMDLPSEPLEGLLGESGILGIGPRLP